MAKKNHQPKSGTFSITQLTGEDVQMLADALGYLRLEILVPINSKNPERDKVANAQLRERGERALALKSIIE